MTWFFYVSSQWNVILSPFVCFQSLCFLSSRVNLCSCDFKVKAFYPTTFWSSHWSFSIPVCTSVVNCRPSPVCGQALLIFLFFLVTSLTCGCSVFLLTSHFLDVYDNWILAFLQVIIFFSAAFNFFSLVFVMHLDSHFPLMLTHVPNMQN